MSSLKYNRGTQGKTLEIFVAVNGLSAARVKAAEAPCGDRSSALRLRRRDRQLSTDFVLGTFGASTDSACRVQRAASWKCAGSPTSPSSSPNATPSTAVFSTDINRISTLVRRASLSKRIKRNSPTPSMMNLLAAAEEESELNKRGANDDRTYNNNTDATQTKSELKESMKVLLRKTNNNTCTKPAEEPNKCSKNLEEEEKLRRLLPYEEAPEHLQHNPYIRHGYRGYLTTKLCLESIFWWTNETINIWSHIFGWMLFFGLTLYDLCLLNIHASFGDKLIVALLLICFQACMILSSVYHTFSCRSAKDYVCFLSFDLFGIALSLLSIYMSGIYYAFWCHKDLQQFYLITVLAIFIVAMILQIPSLNVNETVKLLVFVAWAAYGVLPTLHWSFAMGGMDNPIVRMLLPRVLGMYIISGVAFAIYLSRIPERFYPGCVDYVGSSHQWWHALIVIALYYWHNTGMLYVEYRMHHGCPSNIRL